MKVRHLVLLVVVAGLFAAGHAGAAESSTANRVLTLDGTSGYVQVADSNSLRSFANAIKI